MRRIARACPLIAVAALCGAFLTASAAAAPVFYTKATVGSRAPAVAFTGTTGAVLLEARSANRAVCTGGTISGEATAPTSVENVRITFSGCESGGFDCENTGAGTVETKVLAGTLGNVVAGKTPGIRLFPQATGRGTALASFTCGEGALAIEVRGSVIGSLSGAAGNSPAEGKFAATDTLTFQQAKGIQKWVRFVEGEGGEEQLEASFGGGGGPFEGAGQSMTIKLTSAPKANLGYTL
jgi:hypothetical protein